MSRLVPPQEVLLTGARITEPHATLSGGDDRIQLG